MGMEFSWNVVVVVDRLLWNVLSERSERASKRHLHNHCDGVLICTHLRIRFEGSYPGLTVGRTFGNEMGKLHTQWCNEK